MADHFHKVRSHHILSLVIVVQAQSVAYDPQVHWVLAVSIVISAATTAVTAITTGNWCRQRHSKQHSVRGQTQLLEDGLEHSVELGLVEVTISVCRALVQVEGGPTS